MSARERELELYRAMMGEGAARRQSELARRTCRHCMRVITTTTDHTAACKTPKWMPRG